VDAFEALYGFHLNDDGALHHQVQPVAAV